MSKAGAQEPKPGTRLVPRVVASTPTRRAVTAPGRKLPFQSKKEGGPKHERAVGSGLTRSLALAPSTLRAGNAELSGLETTSQRILNEQLVRLTTLLLRAQSAKTSHDSAAVRDHAYQRATEVVDDELSRIITKLINLQGPSPMHRIVALSQLSTSITRDIERAIFTDDRAYLANFANEQRVRKEEAAIAHAAFAHELATKDQALATLTADKAELERAGLALSRKCEALEKELEKANRNQAQTHQNAVELRMQGLDFKARVDNRCARILASIQSRMGFIPAGIQKQVLYLKVLKAPGDPAYDEMRMHTHTRISKKKFEPERRSLGAAAGGGASRAAAGNTQGVSAWASKVLGEELPASFPKAATARPSTARHGDLRGSIESHDTASVEMQALSRRPRTQEDWIRWATAGPSSGPTIFDHTTAGATSRGYNTFASGDDDGFAGYDDEDDDDEDEGEDVEFDDEEDYDDDEDDAEEVQGGRAAFLSHTGGAYSRSLLGPGGSDDA